jgi:hypothetical protein
MTVGNKFFVGGLGVELQPERSLPSPGVFSRNFLFWDIGPKRQFSIKPETVDKLEKKIADTSATFLLDVLTKSIESAFFRWQTRARVCVCVCAKLRTYFEIFMYRLYKIV